MINTGSTRKQQQINEVINIEHFDYIGNDHISLQIVMQSGKINLTILQKSEEAGRAEFNVATPTYAIVAYSVR